MSHLGLVGVPDVQPTQTLQINLPQPEQWRLYALRLGRDTFERGGRLIFQGAFPECLAFLEFIENIPMNTSGLSEAVSNQQKPQPYRVRAVGPIVTVELTNGKKCLDVKWNDDAE